MIRVFVSGVGLLGPGLRGWEAGRVVLRGDAAWHASDVALPPVGQLPAAERRRIGASVKLALAVGMEAVEQSGEAISDMATVFTSSGGDSVTMHGILEVLATERREVSPTRFHNSVHNAPSGYWAVACAARAPSTSLCAHDASFQVGLLDAAVQAVTTNRPVTLIAYDLPYSAPLDEFRHIGGVFGTALVLTPQMNSAVSAVLEIDAGDGTADETHMGEGALENLRLDIPAARSLPLLVALAGGHQAMVRLSESGGPTLSIRVSMP